LFLLAIIYIIVIIMAAKFLMKQALDRILKYYSGSIIPFYVLIINGIKYKVGNISARCKTYLYIGLHLALKIVAKESIKHFLSNIWSMFIFLVLLNPRNTRACFKQQYPRVLSKYSVVATIWLHRKEESL